MAEGFAQGSVGGGALAVASRVEEEDAPGGPRVADGRLQAKHDVERGAAAADAGAGRVGEDDVAVARARELAARVETVQLSRVHESLALVRGGEDDGVPESPIQRVGEIARGEEPAVLAKTRGGTIHHRELLRLTRPEVRRRGGETHGGERNGEGDHRRAPSRAPKSAAARGRGDRRDTRQFDQPIRIHALRPKSSVSLFRKAREGWNNPLFEAPWRTLRRRR